jgi:UDP-3-O-[3-hydroxymyristoyl] glucosamine N-acyltransferase
MKRRNFTLAELASFTGATLSGNGNVMISGVADLESAGPAEISFLANVRYEQAMRRSTAGAIFIDSKTKQELGKNYLVHENPSQAFQKTVEAFHGQGAEISGFKGIHPTAVIDPSCKIGHGVTVCPYAVIDKEVEIGEGSFIGSGSYVGPYTKIGKRCIIHPHVVVREACLIGDQVIIQPGAVIGSCGFGYLTDRTGAHTKLNQVGSVVIEDDVEVGANTTIDRARFKATRIGKGTKLDNLIQIAHGAIIGEHNIWAAQTGIAGSSQTGKYVVVGGQAAIAGHLKVGDRVMLAGRAGVSKSILKPGKYGGFPAIPLAEYNRMGVFLRNIEKFVQQIQTIQQALQK